MLKKPTYKELGQRIKKFERECLEPKIASSETTTKKDFYETILDGIIIGVCVTDKDHFLCLGSKLLLNQLLFVYSISYPPEFNKVFWS